MKDPPPHSHPRSQKELTHAYTDLTTVERWAAHTHTEPTTNPSPATNQPHYTITTETTDGMHHITAITAHPAHLATEQTSKAGWAEQVAVVPVTDTTPRSSPALSPTEPAPPATGALEPADLSVLRSLVRSLLDLAGHEHGPAHTDIVLTPAGPHVLQCRLEPPHIPR
ncbi:hypothetical protein GXW83_18020 [Streptacidiphilus sp. PB12-B1b]|uniref:hypothetical protein n=1 Tax=Streptacidiphilus sp. PB12-B1b TaxID=2705012 RepID=UPI0015F8785D|nr:hypothetical protein [Streptacidiphilus sp. PB12-B1b]QMU77312.1 hypothetical protein GXW83_18020 [Streptacidiphilus sp. PB12-B1b]